VRGGEAAAARVGSSLSLTWLAHRARDRRGRRASDLAV